MAAVEEAIKLTYCDVLDIIYENLGQDAFYDAATTVGEPFLSLCNQAGIDVTVSPSGTVLGYSKHVVGSKPLSSSEEIAQALNSNIQSGTAAVENTGAFNEIVNTTVEAGKIKPVSTVTKFTNGVKGVLKTPVAGKITPALMAAATGIQLGKTIDSAIYNIGKAMGANPPEELNPKTWNNITADMSDKGLEGIDKWAFNTIFGLDPKTGEAIMYADENAFTYMSQWLQKEGFFIDGITVDEDTITPDNINIIVPSVKILYSKSEVKKFIGSGWSNTSITLDQAIEDLADASFYYVSYNKGVKLFSIVGSNELLNTNTYNFTFHEDSKWGNYLTINPSIDWLPNGLATDTISVGTVSYGTSVINTIGGIHGLFVGTINSPIDGITTQPNATTPDLSPVTTPEETLNLLKQTYPELWDNAVQQDVMQPDGNIKTYTYVPLPMPTEGEGSQVGTTGAVQNQSTVTPDNSTESQLATLIKILTNSQNQPQGQTKELPKDYPINPTKNPNPPDIGGGDTPVVVVPTGSASALYTVYNPTQQQLSSFGAWLWSADFADQIKKLFNDPMQSIIGLHKIFCTPTISGSSNIKVGYLDSGVASNVVSDQYTTLSCGSVDLAEYFGNIFDYSPYTDISVYLPFVGIVRLNTADVMRSKLTVTYHFDILTGACLAEVKVTRDSYDAVMYQYTGNAATQYPLSSGSYMGILSGILSIAGGVAGTVATGGAAAPLLIGSAASALSMKTKVERSGSLSGNSGAMGIKIPYLIISRPQTALADNYQNYVGIPSNQETLISDTTGFVKYDVIHLTGVPATEKEKSEIQTLFSQGVLI